MAEKTIWIVVKRFDLFENPPDTSLNSICINSLCDLKSIFKLNFSIHEPDTLLKLRNHNGNLIPINEKIKENTMNEPYILEVVKYHQHDPMNDDLVPHRLSLVTNRINRIEEKAPGLDEIRRRRIKEELLELDMKIQFLQTRLTEADTIEWKGMFQRNPLW